MGFCDGGGRFVVRGGCVDRGRSSRIGSASAGTWTMMAILHQLL